MGAIHERIKTEVKKQGVDVNALSKVLTESMNHSLEKKSQKRTKPDIEFVTEQGTVVILKWNGTEYRAYKQNGCEMMLGAVIPENLIKYISKNY